MAAASKTAAHTLKTTSGGRAATFWLGLASPQAAV